MVSKPAGTVMLMPEAVVVVVTVALALASRGEVSSTGVGSVCCASVADSSACWSESLGSALESCASADWSPCESSVASAWSTSAVDSDWSCDWVWAVCPWTRCRAVSLAEGTVTPTTTRAATAMTTASATARPACPCFLGGS